MADKSVSKMVLLIMMLAQLLVDIVSYSLFGGGSVIFLFNETILDTHPLGS